MLFFDVFLGIVSAGTLVAIPISLRYLINIASLNRPHISKEITLITIFLAVILLIYYGSLYYVNYYGHMMGISIENDMRNEIFRHFQKLSHKFYDDRKVGELMSTITNDISNISDFMHHFPSEAISVSLKIMAVILVLCLINPTLAIVSMFLILLTIAYVIWYISRSIALDRELFHKISKVNSQLEENLSGIRTIKSFASENTEIEKFKTINKDYVQSHKHRFKFLGQHFSGVLTFINAYSPLTNLIGVMLILNNQFPPKDLLTFAMYEGTLLGPIFTIMALAEQFSRSIAGYSKFYKILEIEPEIKDHSKALLLKNTRGDIIFHNVYFKYEKSKEYILKNLNFEVKPGEYIALVGSSGIGKSTICSLILRLYDPTKGEILIDGVNIKNLKLENLRKNIGFVQQNTFIFSGTVAENIRYGKTDATDDEVLKAAKAAFCHDFISELKNGYNDEVGQGGSKLSGGQKQRISIARVFLKNPPILIFDEATSALDNESERFVQKSMEKLAQGRTTIVIAHRLSTIKNAKRILVITKKGIEEDGTHEELLKKSGPYADFYSFL